MRSNIMHRAAGAAVLSVRAAWARIAARSKKTPLGWIGQRWGGRYDGRGRQPVRGLLLQTRSRRLGRHSLNQGPAEGAVGRLKVAVQHSLVASGSASYNVERPALAVPTYDDGHRLPELIEAEFRFIRLRWACV